MYLKELSIEDSRKIYELLVDVNGEEAGFMIDKVSEKSFDSFLKERSNEAQGIDLKPGRVPQTIYWFYVDERPVGIIKVRRTLTQHLLKHGGNIGYYIKKDSRKLGYGESMLKLCLQKLKDEGMKRILVTCDEDNRGSEKVITSNGGTLEDVIEGTKRYWIEL